MFTFFTWGFYYDGNLSLKEALFIAFFTLIIDLLLIGYYLF